MKYRHNTKWVSKIDENLVIYSKTVILSFNKFCFQYLKITQNKLNLELDEYNTILFIITPLSFSQSYYVILI